jgi:hypothetical protein
MTRLALVLAALAAPALAQSPAAIWPTRDVVVTFDPPAQTGGPDMRVAFSAGGQLARMDVGPQGFGIIDYKGRQMTMVMPEQRMFMVMTLPDDLPAGTDMSNHDFVRLGTRTVAGTGCTDWRVTPRTGQPGQEAVVCLTDDGVMLRSEVSGAQSFVTEAKEVRYGALDPSLFRVPDGFQKLEMAGGMPGQRPRR